MQTIQIEVQDHYTDNVLAILYSLQHTMINTIQVNTPKTTSDFAKERKELEGVFQDYTQNGSKNFTKLDNEYWHSVKNRLLQRHSN